MNDEEHLRRFEDHSLPKEEWTHRAHLKVAYLYLIRFSQPEALERLRVGIQAYNAAQGIQDTPTGGYHETMTQVWLQLVYTALRQFGPADTADAFFDAQTQLCDKRTPLLFYSRNRLMSPEAKHSFVAPDLVPLPRPPAHSSPATANTPTTRSRSASLPRPPSVSNAIHLLWLSLALTIPNLWINWPQIRSTAHLEFGFLILFVTLVFTIWLITMIDEGYHWVRVTFLVLLVIGLPDGLMDMIKCFGDSFISGMLNLTQAVLHVTGVALLFSAGSRPWFGRSETPQME
ncbi:MAG: hypothetical protein WAW39_14720 [Prosthecobacter sp.]|uniref:hypothetical protein n=1 Tax=Prosthecobacter sp. TaxID=1965333 RepID=UPI003BB03065